MSAELLFLEENELYMFFHIDIRRFSLIVLAEKELLSSLAPRCSNHLTQ